jgi:hypothetical protein
MRIQTGILIGAALVLGSIYALKFTDWFGTKSIHILYIYRKDKAIFGLEGKEYRLNTVKVYQASEIATNKYAHALWHLVASGEGSSAVTDFTYGSPISGMKPAVPNTKPEKLQKDVKYRIIVESGKVKGEREFQVH